MKIFVLSVIPVAGSVNIGEQTIDGDVHFDAEGHDPLPEPNEEEHILRSPSSPTNKMALLQTSAERRGALMEAVGHRDAHSIASAVQELAHESISGQAQTFDNDMREALKVIKTVFVKSIQTALMQSHKVDQEHLSCFTQDCFGGCIDQYKATMDACDKLTNNPECDKLSDAQQLSVAANPQFNPLEAPCGVEGLSAIHRECRKGVHTKYVDMAQKCGALSCFNVEDEKVHRAEQCTAVTCTAPDLHNCHKKNAYSNECQARDGSLNEAYGGWLTTMITKFEASYARWEPLHTSCTEAYQAFMTADVECDVVQTNFEKTACQRNHCEAKACSVDYDRCEAQCWEQYQEIVQDKRCLEKDRKIDWSATKKIECYIGVLLHNYTKEDLAENCHGDDCINKKREEDYNTCAGVCRQIDYDGEWPTVNSVDPVSIESTFASKTRKHVDQYHLGDKKYECDANGEDIIFTKNRGQGEDRCSEHLDIDYQIPRCMACKEAPLAVCEPTFIWKHYGPDTDKNGNPERGFDDLSRIDGIRECKPDDKRGCFPDVPQLSTTNGIGGLIEIEVPEHSHAWGFNRCPCAECSDDNPGYPGRPEGRQCGMGPHTMNPGPHRMVNQLEIRNVCVEPKGGSFASFKLPKDVCAKGIQINHLRGKVSCRHDRATGDSNWGCDGDSLGLVVSDGDQVTAPVFDTTVGMTPDYKHHAHWYKMDGVDKNSLTMNWLFTQPFLFKEKEYKLWYNEALSGLSTGDNHGRACYNLAFDPTDTEICTAADDGAGSLAPLQYRSVCVGAKDETFHRITLPENTCVTEIALHHIQGYLACTRSDYTKSNFGCSSTLVGLHWADNNRKVVMPLKGQLEGVVLYGWGGKPNWWRLTGSKRYVKNARTISMKVKNDPVKMSGDINLWYGQDLGDFSQHNNHGTACYEVSVHRALSC